jgi:hypothetical protein
MVRTIGPRDRGCPPAGASRFGHAAGFGYSFKAPGNGSEMRMWRSGSASPCQGEGREFESRHPLECWWSASAGRGMWATTRGGVAERRGSGLQSRPHGFESRRHLNHQDRHHVRNSIWAIGAAVARFPDTEEVTGSIPVSPTIETKAPGIPGGLRRSADTGRRRSPDGSPPGDRVVSLTHSDDREQLCQTVSPGSPTGPLSPCASTAS